MTKAILSLIAGLVTLTIIILRLWFTRRAKRERLLKKIRELENEMSKHPVGSYHHIRLRYSWLQLNKEIADTRRKRFFD